MERDNIIRRLSEIALHEPVVYAVMTRYKQGDIQLEHAMLACVDMLCKQSEAYRAQVVELLSRQTR